MRRIYMLFMFITLTCGIVCAFSNSLDSNQASGIKQKNNFSSPNSNTFRTNSDKPFNPQEHKGFNQQDNRFPEPTMNDSRYNSNCQFGVCMPGGFAK